MGLGLGSTIAGASFLSEFSLSDINGLQLWLKNGEGVTAAQWNDSSGNNNHAAQSESAKQGAVEDGGIDFNSGNADHYDLTSTITTSTFTVFVAMEPDSGTSMSFLGGSNGNDFMRINQSADYEFRSKRDGAFDLTVSHSTDFSFEGNGGVEKFIIMVRQEADNTVTVGINNDLDNFALANSTGEAMDFNLIGCQNDVGANAFDGTIYEVAIYNEVLSVSDATLVRENMASRVGITL